MTPLWVTPATAFIALIIAIATAWRLVIRPAVRTFAQIDNLTPVLRQIAQDFRPNGHPSLKQQMDALQKDVPLLKEDIAIIKADVQAIRAEQRLVSAALQLRDHDDARS